MADLESVNAPGPRSPPVRFPCDFALALQNRDYLGPQGPETRGEKMLMCHPEEIE